eukprot:CAMPEP_0113845816 /NCGR_PEP_ID=MMETSP0372-20130328/966_1 /TAXON_ID=340204 /ORGANISM="Lankesteria abbotti" /LENGTH=398 /DNA_ID=CAMNT_0000814899 /DNA_START=30 /DNA_END=1224 /DNA_ORIENTATION=+ /assembly_acc=CAM_ASM_000359
MAEKLNRSLHPSKKHQDEIEKLAGGSITQRQTKDKSMLGNLTHRLFAAGGVDKSVGSRKGSGGMQPLYTTTTAQQLEANYDELWVRSTTRDKRRLFYVIPGNPGLTKAYASFAKMICLRFSADVCVVSHLGHCSFSDDHFGTESQVTHHQRILRKHSQLYGSVVLLGHSVGGWFALRVADQSHDLTNKLAGIGLLAPTLSRFHWKTFYPLKFFTNPIVSYLLALVGPYVPFVRWVRPEVSPELLTEIRSGKFISNMLFLAKDELLRISKELPKQILSKFGIKKKLLFVVYAKKDPYVSPEAQQMVKDCGEDAGVVLPTVVSVEALRHTFCLKSSNCLAIVDLMSDFFVHGGFSPKTLAHVDQQLKPASFFGVYAIFLYQWFPSLCPDTQIHSRTNTSL